MNAKLALDATASIGLEKYHSYADVVSFSSCKGLFGLTGASFVASVYSKNKIFIYYFSHLNKKMTGPYHILQFGSSFERYNFFLKSVQINKKNLF